MGNHALRQVVGLDRARDRQSLQLWNQAPVPADYALNEARVGEMIEAAFLPIPLPRGVNEGQMLWLTDPIAAAGSALKEVGVEGNGNGLRKPDTDKTAGCYRVSGTDETYGLARRFDLLLVARGRRSGASKVVATHCDLMIRRDRAQRC